MDILKLSIDWAKAEVFSAKISLLLSLLFFLAALGLWQLGKTAMAKAFVWPMLVAGILIAAVSAGLYFANKPRITQFETAYKNDPGGFIQSEMVLQLKNIFFCNSSTYIDECEDSLISLTYLILTIWRF